MDSTNKLMTPEQFKQKYEYMQRIHSHFANLRYETLKTAIPETIIITYDGEFQPRYSKDIEDALREINKMEEAYMQGL